MKSKFLIKLCLGLLFLGGAQRAQAQIYSPSATSDSTNLYYQFKYSGTPTFLRVFLDTDRNASTGFIRNGIGADYLIENAYLYKYSGSNGSWGWTFVKTVSTAKTSRSVKWTVAKTNLGSPASLNFYYNMSNPTSTTAVMTQTISSTTWTFCADENGTCNYSGTKVIRYGSNGTYVTKTLAGPVACDNTTFGDPLVGVVKHCDLSSDTVTQPAPTTTPTTTTTTIPTPSPTTSHAPPPTSTLVVSVKDTGAVGNGSTNDTAAIQAAINQVGGTGGTVYVPDGIYLINAVTELKLKSNMTFKMSSGAVLKAIPTDQANYNVISVRSATNVNIIGGTLIGDRYSHIGGVLYKDFGMGVGIYSASNIYVENVTDQDMWGDGFYVGGYSVAPSTNITLDGVVSNNNRRQGLSVTSADGIVVKNSVFKNTNGAQPQCGIDIEPNTGESVKNVQVLNNGVSGNASCGIELYAGAGQITNASISGNKVYGTYATILYNTSNHSIRNNILNSPGVALDFRGTSTANTVTGNSICAPIPVSGGSDSSILSTGSKGNFLSGNTISTTNCQLSP